MGEELDIERILRMAINAGASEAEVYRVWSREVEVEATEKIRSCETLELDAIGLRVAVGKRVAVVGTQDTSMEGIRKAVEAAVSIARAQREDPDWKGLNEKMGKTPLTGLWDKEVAEALPEDLAGIVRDALNAVPSASPISKPVYLSASLTASVVEIVSSYGGPLERRSTFAQCGLEVKAVREGREGTYSDSTFSRSLKDFKLVETAEKTAVKAVDFIGSSPVETGDYDVILAPRVAAAVLNIMLSPAVSALSVQQGRSPLAGRVGEEVFSRLITILDTGADPKAPGAREFDGEGYPTSNRVLVEKGVLLDYVYDSYTAKKENRESTGNAWRSYASAPAPSPNHLVLKPGDSSLDEMIREVKRGLLIEGTIGEWLSNPVSGNLNATVTHAYLIEEGEVKRTVKGVVLSGNFYELMKKNISLIGKDVEVRIAATTPHILLRSVKIAGK